MNKDDFGFSFGVVMLTWLVYNLIVLAVVFKLVLYFNNYWLLLFAFLLKTGMPKIMTSSNVDDEDDSDVIDEESYMENNNLKN